MSLNSEAKQTLLANIAALEELPIERIPAVIGDKKPEEISPLYRICSPIEITPDGLTEAKNIVSKMTSVLQRYREITETGRAFAANQIGIEKQVVVFLYPDGKVFHYINPAVIERSEDRNVYWEICMSGAPLGVDVIRSASVLVHWYDINGKEYTEQLTGFDARRIQHEIDHLQGKVCYNTEGTVSDTLGYGLNPKEYMNQELRPIKK